MKGNEARVVFFLQPVDQFRDGEVAKVEKSFWSYFGFRSLLLLGLLLGLGFLTYVLAQIEGQEPAVSTTTAPTTTTVTTTSTTTTANDNITTTTESPSPTVSPTSLPGHEKQTKQADMRS